LLASGYVTWKMVLDQLMAEMDWALTRQVISEFTGF